MIPWFQITELELLGLRVPVFGLFTCLAALMIVWRCHTVAPRFGVARGLGLELGLAAVFAGLIGAHVVAVAFYDKTPLTERPVSALLDVFNGMASTGAVLGGVIGASALARLARRPILPVLDTLALALPPALLIGRIGCFLVHDHPGIRTECPLAVAYPGGGRFDLGLVEALVGLLLVALLNLRGSALRRAGQPAALVLVVYGSLRFLADFLRIDGADAQAAVAAGIVRAGDVDHRMGGLTFAQWVWPAGVAIGAWLWWRSTRSLDRASDRRVFSG